MSAALKIFCVGLTGGIGAGKSAVSALLAARGARVADADAIGRALTAPGGAGAAAVRTALGEWTTAADGGMNREAVRRKVFADPSLRKKLEAVLHPLIRTETIRILSEPTGRVGRSGRTGRAEKNGDGDGAGDGVCGYGILSAPLLLESGALTDLCDRILVVDCDLDLRAARAAARDGTDASEIRLIASAQLSRGERLARADDILENNGGMAELEFRVSELHRKYERLARDKAEGK